MCLYKDLRILIYDMHDLKGIHYSLYILADNQVELLCSPASIHKTLIPHFLCIYC